MFEICFICRFTDEKPIVQLIKLWNTKSIPYLCYTIIYDVSRSVMEIPSTTKALVEYGKGSATELPVSYNILLSVVFGFTAIL